MAEKLKRHGRIFFNDRGHIVAWITRNGSQRNHKGYTVCFDGRDADGPFVFFSDAVRHARRVIHLSGEVRWQKRSGQK